ncbi:peptidase M14 family protein, partial [Candidatus Bathyarchaeota archaeon]|nr:peptidase M14 family protein [Candidatus Bathyarchaeota archaeon]
PPRIGLFQRFYGGNVDEGWTRLVLEQFGFSYTTIMDKEVREGGLHDRYDVIIMPDDSEAMITGEGLEEYARARGRPLPSFPPEYRSGLGEDGVESLREFVWAGGRLVCINASSVFAVNAFSLKVRNVLKGLDTKEFFCPGSTIHAEIDRCHPMGYGMPREGLVFFWDGLAFEILPSGENDRYEVVVSYGERDLLESGWLIGEEKLMKKPAMVVASVGEGEVVLFGFRPQHRAQTHGTYKLFFNTLF